MALKVQRCCRPTASSRFSFRTCHWTLEQIWHLQEASVPSLSVRLLRGYRNCLFKSDFEKPLPTSLTLLSKTCRHLTVPKENTDMSALTLFSRSCLLTLDPEIIRQIERYLKIQQPQESWEDKSS